MSRRYVLFAAVYGSGPLALDGLRVLSSAGRENVAGCGLMRRDEDGRTTLEGTGGSAIMRAALLGLVVGFAAGLGTVLMWFTALIGAAIGALVGYHDRKTEARELRSLVGELVPKGGCAIVAVAEQGLAARLSHQFDLAQATRMIPISGRRMSELARRMASGNSEVLRALDGPQR
ncbi:MAG TPA: hypothetical protein VES03_02075 [Motilibacterales bacterium]|nr:hypothetical protein [Motilibacterales bacterium]